MHENVGEYLIYRTQCKFSTGLINESLIHFPTYQKKLKWISKFLFLLVFKLMTTFSTASTFSLTYP